MTAKEHQILFNGEMVRAMLAGRKFVTRRVVKPQPLEGVNRVVIRDGKLKTYEDRPSGRIHILEKPDGCKCPYGVSGDTLWVRETWAGVDWLAYDCDKDPPETIGYRADKSALHMGTPLETTHWNWDLVKWKPSIHMPRWASRIDLEVTGVRVERVQDISEEDAKAEGVKPMTWLNHPDTTPAYRVMFEPLWNSIYAKRGYSWDSNPWVWVIEFKPIAP